MQKLAEIQLSYKPSLKDSPTIQSSHDAYVSLMDYYPEDTIGLQERFVVLYLNNANRVIGAQVLSIGGITSTVADIRLVYATALKVMASGIIVSHNHPSYLLRPSEQDKRLTNKLKEAGEILDIKLLDHLIISPNNDYLSFSDEGHI